VSFTIAEIAQHINGKIVGDPNYIICGVGTLSSATSTQLSFLSNNKYKKFLSESKAGVIIVGEGLANSVNTNAIEVANPYVAYAKAATFICVDEKQLAKIHHTAWIDDSASIGANVSIGPNVSIAENVTIANNVRIAAGTVIEHDVSIAESSDVRANVTICYGSKIGAHVLIHPGVVIGADGFGIANDNGRWIKVPQLGSVVISDYVEIGANTTIDRGAIDDTFIAEGVKLDNQIQIAHNVKIGKHTVIAGCVGIAGSTTIGENCAVGGGSGVAGHLDIADGVQLMGMSMVTKSIRTSGVYSSGIPSEPSHTWQRNIARYRQLDKLFDRVKALEVTEKPQS